MSMSAKPWWRSAIEQVDAWAEPHISTAVHHESFARATGAVYHLRHVVARESAKVSATVLHTLNLPTRSDVTRVVKQLADVERELRGISDQIGKRDKGAR
jgi:hypothetical protein